jgi:hypothetical protein
VFTRHDSLAQIGPVLAYAWQTSFMLATSQVCQCGPMTLELRYTYIQLTIRQTRIKCHFPRNVIFSFGGFLVSYGTTSNVFDRVVADVVLHGHLLLARMRIPAVVPTHRFACRGPPLALVALMFGSTARVRRVIRTNCGFAVRVRARDTRLRLACNQCGASATLCVHGMARDEQAAAIYMAILRLPHGFCLRTV